MQVYHGIVEDVNDPMKADRVRVRVYELHTDMKSEIPTDSLPWAQVMASTDDASMSGIGLSGTGLVCGSWVNLYFLDEDLQYPVVIGSLKGIQIEPGKTVAHDVNETVFTTQTPSASVLIDSSGNPVTTEYGAPITTGTEPTSAVPVGARRASDFKSIGERGIILIQGSEGFRGTAYQDDGGIWTIGYGTTYYPDGRSVSPGDTITRQYAAEIFASDVNQKFLPIVHKNVTVPVTQQMVDALVSLVYNIGQLKKSQTLLTDLNSGKYELAASRFLDYNKIRIRGVLTESRGLTARRIREKDLFLSGGIPSDVGEVEEFPLPPEPPRAIPIEPLPTFDDEQETNKKLSSRGFSDPNGKYPLYRNEPDTHRLARHEKIVDTIVYKKETSRDMDVVIAGYDGKKTWNQSPIPYNARYPKNRVRASESGHILEFDDTENSRRIHLYHAAGTYLEIDDNGTMVRRIVGDGYEILERNGFVHVKGNLHVNVEGAHTLKVSGACKIDIDGATTINVFNDVKLNVSGNMESSIAGNHVQHVRGDMSIKVDGKYAVDASRIDLNSNVATPLEAPKPKVEVEDMVLSELTVITRGTESAMQYETPDETGDLTTYTNTRLAKGEVTSKDFVEPEQKETTSIVASSATQLTSDCGTIHTMTSFPPSYQLSRHFRIGSFNKEGSRPLIPQMGLTPQTIACNLKVLSTALDLVKDMFPHMIISSGFRRPGDAANSSKTSKHYSGEAVDIQLPGYTRKEYIRAIERISELFSFDQLILEYQGPTTWIHLGVSKTSQRRQIFTMSNHKRIGDMGELVLLA